MNFHLIQLYMRERYLIMKFISIVLILALHSCGLAQDSLTLSGRMEIVSYYAGGAALTEYDQEPQPYSKVLMIVSIEHLDSVPTVVAVIKPDSDGYFSIKLPPGKYGFAEKRSEIKVGQYQPPVYEENSIHEHVYRGWESNIEMPLVLRRNVDGWVLTYYDVTSCFDCP